MLTQKEEFLNQSFVEIEIFVEHAFRNIGVQLFKMSSKFNLIFFLRGKRPLDNGLDFLSSALVQFANIYLETVSSWCS